MNVINTRLLQVLYHRIEDVCAGRHGSVAAFASHKRCLPRGDGYLRSLGTGHVQVLVTRRDTYLASERIVSVSFSEVCDADVTDRPFVHVVEQLSVSVVHLCEKLFYGGGRKIGVRTPSMS